MYKSSEKVVSDILELFPTCIKVVFEGEVLYDDTETNESPIDEVSGVQMPFRHPDFEKFLDRRVYDFTVDIVHFHHYRIFINQGCEYV